MPLAPPVRIATRPSRRAMLCSLASIDPLVFSTMLHDELGESGKLLLDEAYRLLVLDLPGLLVDPLRHVADENLRFVHRQRVEKDHAAAYVILHAAAAENAGRGRDQRDRLIGEGLIGDARDPVDRIL